MVACAARASTTLNIYHIYTYILTHIILIIINKNNNKRSTAIDITAETRHLKRNLCEVCLTFIHVSACIITYHLFDDTKNKISENRKNENSTH